MGLEEFHTALLNVEWKVMTGKLGLPENAEEDAEESETSDRSVDGLDLPDSTPGDKKIGPRLDGFENTSQPASAAGVMPPEMSQQQRPDTIDSQQQVAPGTEADFSGTPKPMGASPVMMATARLSAIFGNQGGQGQTTSDAQSSESHKGCSNARTTSGATILGKQLDRQLFS